MVIDCADTRSTGRLGILDADRGDPAKNQKDAYVDDLHSAARHAGPDPSPDYAPPSIAAVREAGSRIASNIERVIEGKPDAVTLGLAVLLAEGHLLI